jgi:hypothetical protein
MQGACFEGFDETGVFTDATTLTVGIDRCQRKSFANNVARFDRIWPISDSIYFSEKV